MNQEPCYVPTYNLRTQVLESFLRYAFDDPNIICEVRNTYFTFHLPKGMALTEAHQREIRKLKGVRTWKPPSPPPLPQ